jgi:hypothetical protein
MACSRPPPPTTITLIALSGIIFLMVSYSP